MRSKKLLTLLGSICLILVLAVLPFMVACAEETLPPEEEEAPPPPPVEEEVFDWNYQNAGMRGTSAFAIFEGLAEELGEVTGGRINLTIYGAGELTPEFDSITALKKELAEICLDWPGYWVGDYPIGYFLVGWPGIWRSNAEIDLYFNEFGGADLCSRFLEEVHNFKYLGYTHDYGIPLLSKKPIRTIDDFKGLKVRASGTSAKVLEELGASVVIVPGAETYTALATGVVDAALFSNARYATDLGLHEVSDYVYWLTRAHVSGVHMIKMEDWNSLPDDLKALLELWVRDCCWSPVPLNAVLQLEVTEGIWPEYGLEICELSAEDEAKVTAAVLRCMKREAERDTWSAEAYENTINFLEFLGR